MEEETKADMVVMEQPAYQPVQKQELAKQMPPIMHPKQEVENLAQPTTTEWKKPSFNKKRKFGAAKKKAPPAKV